MRGERRTIKGGTLNESRPKKKGSCPFLPPPSSFLLFLIVMAALSIRLLSMIYFKSYVIPGEDQHWAFGFETGRIAKALATGEGFGSPFRDYSGPTSWLAPLYPCFLALIFKIFGLYTTEAALAALTVNCFVSALTCLPLYHVTRMLFGREVGYLAAASLAIYPPSIWHAINTIWDTTIFTFLAVLLVYWLLTLPQRLTSKNAAISGLFMGLTALVNPVITAFYPLAFIWLFLQSTAAHEKKIKYMALLLILGSVTLAPWLVRNYRVFGRLMIKSNFGLELKRGNNPQAWSATDPRAWELVHPSISRKEFLLYVQMKEVNYVKRCYDEALVFIKENPGKFLQLCLRRVYYFWLDDLGGKDEWKGNMKVAGSIGPLKELFYVLPLPFVVAGIFFAVRRKLEISLLLFFLLSIPAIYYVTHVTSRYRYPIEPILLVFASYGFYSLVWHREK